MLGNTLLRGAGKLGLAFGLLLAVLPRDAAVADDEALLRSVAAEGHIVIMRHALAPGTGDPGNFALRDCSTQRNLSDTGRAQAERIGARLRDAGLGSARVLSSQWCRCLETAELLGLGPVEELEPLNSFFRQREKQPAATQALKDWLAAQPSGEPLVLVTHQVNITALTSVFPQSGEMIVLEQSDVGGGLSVVGRVQTD
ncbi:histidine phosphatase family protein [Denitrobaculum tricleocarpae]|uniref:Histidine phosphatase family protein n=1 Tax=Denitrobaculum tricleocarpae TaxID=2591009 RepID=A0A545T092_9PROT|nr:histidine phosphatase family protein [Denitrobaculum tricleocarpae]TQV70632.1 histidine phosphatase family protein [Denitrobaculum tricleocarpae]